MIIIIITTTITITFILIQEIYFTDSILSWKTFICRNSAQWPYLYVITQTSETVNVNLELGYLLKNKFHWKIYLSLFYINYMIDKNLM